MARIEQIRLQIDDMSCGHCIHAVKTALERHPGVTTEDVQLGTATVRADLDVTTPDAIARTVDEAGYPARVA